MRLSCHGVALCKRLPRKQILLLTKPSAAQQSPASTGSSVRERPHTLRGPLSPRRAKNVSDFMSSPVGPSQTSRAKCMTKQKVTHSLNWTQSTNTARLLATPSCESDVNTIMSLCHPCVVLKSRTISSIGTGIPVKATIQQYDLSKSCSRVGEWIHHP
jgi:hypothetical protein